jgi:hypothetical protein
MHFLEKHGRDAHATEKPRRMRAQLHQLGAIVCILILTCAQIHAAQNTIGRSSVARLPDGRVVLLQADGNLRLSSTPQPVTLKDFGKPMVAFGDGGLFSPDLQQKPTSVLLISSVDLVHVISTAGKKLHWHRVADPAGENAKWQHEVVTFPGEPVIQDVVSQPAGRLHALCVESSGIGVAALESGSTRTFAVAKIAGDKAAVHARAAADDADNLEIVWAASDSAGPIHRAQWSPGKTELPSFRVIGEGAHPDITVVGGRTLVAWERSDDSLQVQWKDKHGGAEGAQTLRGRASRSPTFAVDIHGVVWLLGVSGDGHGLFYRRFLGSGFSAEAECGVAPGAWKMSDLAVQTAMGASDDGLAILHVESVETAAEATRHRFHNLPVPRLSVTDARRVLLLDMLEISQMQDLEQRVPEAVRWGGNPLNLNGPPGSHDSAVAGYATVMHDNGKFRMWYNAEGDSPGRNWVICYAESDDGIHWKKPSLGLIEHNGSRDNNLLFPVEYHTNTPLIIRDDQETDAQRRYKMVFETEYEGGEMGAYYTWSADGLRWPWPPQRLWGKAPGKNHTSADFYYPFHEPLSSFFRDPISTHPDYLWKMYGQTAGAGHPHPDGRRQRNVNVAHGRMPDELVPFDGESVLDPRSGSNEDQIHGAMVQPYEGLYVSLYQHWWGKEWNVDLRLAVSRDGLHFARIQPEAAVLGLGRTGSWDSGMLTTPNFLLHHDGKLWLYYRGSIGSLATGKAFTQARSKSAEIPQTEGWIMWTGLARLREDGFAYVTVSAWENLDEKPQVRVPNYRIALRGGLKTIPIDARGIESRALHVNLENLAAAFASIRAQITDAASGQTIAGYSFADCDPLGASSLDQVVTWRGGSASLSEVKVARVRLEFELTGMMDSPRLYSFWFADRKTVAGQ